MQYILYYFLVSPLHCQYWLEPREIFHVSMQKEKEIKTRDIHYAKEMVDSVSEQGS